VILSTVMDDVANDVARRGSPVLFRFPPQGDPSAVVFELHESGQWKALASLRFEMNASGSVSVRADILGLHLPPARLVNEVDRAWVKDIALSFWEATLVDGI
jgi:hypothetical protein